MPIVERDPWRIQYFESAACPEDVFIPIEDSDAYKLYASHRWVYNKLTGAERQDLVCGLHGMEPPAYPVFSKSIYNMRGMGSRSRLLRSSKVWEYDDKDRRDGYSVVLFGAHNAEYRYPDPALVDGLRQRPDISSIQITFHEDKPIRAHAMPPGGFRLAIVNCWDLDEGIAAREELALGFWSTQRLIERCPRGVTARGLGRKSSR